MFCIYGMLTKFSWNFLIRNVTFHMLQCFYQTTFSLTFEYAFDYVRISNWLFPFTGYSLMKNNLIPITCNSARLLIKWALNYVLGLLIRLSRVVPTGAFQLIKFIFIFYHFHGLNSLIVAHISIKLCCNINAQYSVNTQQAKSHLVNNFFGLAGS